MIFNKFMGMEQRWQAGGGGGMDTSDEAKRQYTQQSMTHFTFLA